MSDIQESADGLADRCLVWATEHTLGNIARVGVGSARELADDVLLFVQSELDRAAGSERDAERARCAGYLRGTSEALWIEGASVASVLETVAVDIERGEHAKVAT